MSSQRFRIVLWFFLGLFPSLSAQQSQSGVVSYVSDEHVYVRFASTEYLKVSDTLFFKGIPALQVVKKSSISSINKRIAPVDIKTGDTLIYIYFKEIIEKKESSKRDGTQQQIQFADTTKRGSLLTIPKEKPWEWDGILGLSSRYNQTILSEANRSLTRQFVRFSIQGKSNTPELPLSVTLTGNYQHFGSAFSETSYPKWGRFNIFQANLDYKMSSNWSVRLGRGFQPGLSSVGALDAINVTYVRGGLTVGAVTGLSPNLINYGLNPDRPLYGLNTQFSRQSKELKWHMGAGWFDQYYKGLLDRRLWVSQGSIYTPKGNLFFMLEGDATNGWSSHRMQSVFVSGRVRLNDKWSIFSSYDTRLPWIFWNSYDRISIDALIDRESQQGWRTRLQYKAGKNTHWGFHATIRQRENANSLFMGGFNIDQRRLFWKGSSLSYRFSAADYGIWQNTQQTLRLRQTFNQWDITAFYRSVLFTRRYTLGSLFNQSYVGLQTSIPLKNRYELDAFVEYDFQQQQQQLLMYLTLNKRF